MSIVKFLAGPQAADILDRFDRFTGPDSVPDPVGVDASDLGLPVGRWPFAIDLQAAAEPPTSFYRQVESLKDGLGEFRGFAYRTTSGRLTIHVYND